MEKAVYAPSCLFLIFTRSQSFSLPTAPDTLEKHRGPKGRPWQRPAPQGQCLAWRTQVARQHRIPGWAPPSSTLFHVVHGAMFRPHLLLGTVSCNRERCNAPGMAQVNEPCRKKGDSFTVPESVDLPPNMIFPRR